MTDRVIRDELFQSDRFLDLPTDTDRLAFVALVVVRADDFGNFEDNPRALFRFLHGVTQVKTEEACATLLGHLLEVDLIRPYQFEVDGKQKRYYHIPKFRMHRQYLVRRYPSSPWDADRKIGKSQRVENRGLAKYQALTENLDATSHSHGSNVDTMSLPSGCDVAQGVGVGVGVGVGEKRFAPPDNSAPRSSTGALTWAEHWKAKGKAFGIEARKGESEGDYCRRVMLHHLIPNKAQPKAPT